MTIDANILIAYLGGEERVVEAILIWKHEGRILLVPTVAESEVLSFTGWTIEERLDAEKFLEENFTSVAFDRVIARIAAEIRRGMRIKIPDAAIAATALATRTPLVTRNRKDFQRIAGLDIISL